MDAGKNHIFRDFNPQTTGTNDQDMMLSETFHRIITENVALTTEK